MGRVHFAGSNCQVRTGCPGGSFFVSVHQSGFILPCAVFPPLYHSHAPPFVFGHAATTMHDMSTLLIFLVCVCLPGTGASFRSRRSAKRPAHRVELERPAKQRTGEVRRRAVFADGAARGGRPLLFSVLPLTDFVTTDKSSLSLTAIIIVPLTAINIR